MLRRLLALGAALVVLILIVLGVKGCLDARARGALSDYSRNVEQIVNETNQTSKRFFEKLEDPGSLSVTEFTGEVDADSSAALAELVAKGAGGTLFLETDDCQASYDELSARGVTFNDPPTVQPYGIDTSFRDPSGNNIRLTQVLEFDPARGTAK